MNQDVLSRLLCPDLHLRIYTVTSPGASREILRLHQPSPAAAAHLVRALNGTALLSASLKPDTDQNLSLSLTGNGPLREIHIQADARGHIRGYVSEREDQAGQHIGFLPGDGILRVTRNLGLKEPYTYAGPLQRGDIAGELAYYLTVSEQVPSALILAFETNDSAIIRVSGGLLIQTLPDTPPGVIELVEDRVRNPRLSLADHLASGGDIYSYAMELLDNAPLHLLQSQPLTLSCRCSYDMLRGVLCTLPRSELDSMIEEGGNTEVVCTFCREKYLFTPDDLREMLPSQ